MTVDDGEGVEDEEDTCKSVFGSEGSSSDLLLKRKRMRRMKLYLDRKEIINHDNFQGRLVNLQE